MGVVNLEYVDDIIAKRRELSLQYNIGLKNVKGYFPTWNTNSDPNFAYYPIVLQTEQLLLNVMEELGKNQIFTRRYFYPSLASALPYLEPKDLPITDDISKRVLCLPLYYDLTIEEVNLITRLILRTQNNTQW